MDSQVAGKTWKQNITRRLKLQFPANCFPLVYRPREEEEEETSNRQFKLLQQADRPSASSFSLAFSKHLTLTKHVANMPVSRQRPQLVLPPGVALVVVPGKLHHLQHKQRAHILVSNRNQPAKPRCNYICVAQGNGNDSLSISAGLRPRTQLSHLHQRR